jgi:hypothetical protein
MSYRGIYAELAIPWVPRGGDNACLVKDLVKKLEDAVGSTQDGYKGGYYEMDNGTPMWVDNWGEASGTAVVDVQDHDYIVIIETFHRE